MTANLELNGIFNAVIFAARKHQGQVRKDERGSPYVTHPISVAQVIFEIGKVRDTQTLIAAILHDTIEDTPTTHQEVKENFGEDILSVVLEVTDDKSLEKMKRKRLQVSHAPQLSHQARMIKIADKLVNCGDILVSPPNGWLIQRRREYIQWGADVVSQIRGTNPGLEAAFDHLLKEAEEQLDFSVQPFDSIDQRPWGPEKPNP